MTRRRPEPGIRAVGLPRPTRLVVSPASGSAGEMQQQRAFGEPARGLGSVARGRSLVRRVRALDGPVVSCWPGVFRVSLLVLKAAGGLFKLDTQIVVARGGAKREGFQVMPAAHIVQPKVPKPPRQSTRAANRVCGDYLKACSFHRWTADELRP